MDKKSDSEVNSNGQSAKETKEIALQWADYYEKQAEKAATEGKANDASLAKQWSDYYRLQAEAVQVETKSDENEKEHVNNSMDTSDASPNEEPVVDLKKEDAVNDKKDAKKKKVNPEIEKYWKIVKKDFKDFNSWTYLLQLIENEDDVEEVHHAMDSFLKHYPYCYGYWKKYADIVKKHHGFDEVEKVFERGVEAIPLSIDLWIHYLEWTIKLRFKDKNENNDEHIRKLFNRALEVCGMEFKSDRLWQMALDWESQKRNSRNVFALYERLISIPTQSYSTHYTSITEIVQNTDPLEILQAEELRILKLQIQRERMVAAEAAKAAQPNEDAVIAATLIPDTAADALGKPTGAITDPHDLPLSEEDEHKLIKEKILAAREFIHKKTAEEVTKRWQFEEAVKRPYFHVKALEKSQLKNWREYLDFEIKEGVQKRITLLFERCLIACALYEEFWIKYARYTYEVLNNTNEARQIFRRGCVVHLPMKVNLALEWTEFEEKVSGFDEALSVLDEYEKRHPGIIAVKVHRLGILRRSGKLDTCENILDETLKSVSNANVKAFWAHKYARFCLKVLKNSSKAKEILSEIVKEQPSNAKLAMHLVDVLYTDNDIDGMLDVLEECVQRENLTAQERIAFSQCRLDFLDDLACDVKLVVAAKLAHESLQFDLKERKQKRKVESSEATTATYTGGDGAGAKRTKVDQDWYQQFQQPSGSGDYSSQQFYQQQWANYYSGNSGSSGNSGNWQQ